MGEVVLITGCSSGIGAATAARLLRAGYQVYATARNPDTLADLRAAGARVLALDLEDEASLEAAVETIRTQTGRIDILINNAGYSQSGALETLPVDRLRRQFETNVFGLIRLTQLVLPLQRDAGEGVIINIGSIVGRLTFPGAGAYAASKHALRALTDALRFEVSGFGIRVVLIEPGLIRTRFTAAVAQNLSYEASDVYARFNADVARLSAHAYEEGPMAKLGGDADAVARVIQTALESRRPRSRYTVTPSATVLLTLRRWLPDRIWDYLLSRQFPKPRA